MIWVVIETSLLAPRFTSVSKQRDVISVAGVQARGERHVSVPPRAAVEEQGRRRQDASGVQVPRAPRQLLWYAAQENSAQQEANVGGGREKTQRRREYNSFVVHW